MVESYSKAGVDIKKAENALSATKDLILSTHNKAVISPENGFAALYEINDKQVIASATDGVGTKLDIAISMKNHSTIGIDLVAMVVNDLAVYGIKPLFFLDYLATSKLEPEVFSEIIKGIVEGCKQAGCALIGGETAEMPGFYPDKKYDLAGFAIGLANKDELITGKDIEPSDVIIGFSSSGLHSNGFSLVRKIIKDKDLSLDSEFDGSSLGKTLLEPTLIYSSLVEELKQKTTLKGLAHITGGGFKNIERILPDAMAAFISKDSWQRPAIIDFLKEQGEIDEAELFDIFNMGVGMVAVAAESEAEKIMGVADGKGLAAFKIGRIKKGNKEVSVE